MDQQKLSLPFGQVKLFSIVKLSSIVKFRLTAKLWKNITTIFATAKTSLRTAQLHCVYHNFTFTIVKTSPKKSRTTCSFFIHYSVRRAITGSFFAAAFAGIKPLIKVSTTLIATIAIPCPTGNAAKPAIPVKNSSSILMGMDTA